MPEHKKGSTILLTGEDALIFKAFKDNRDKFIDILASGAFDLPSGKIEINIHNDQVQSIHLYHMTFKRQAKK